MSSTGIRRAIQNIVVKLQENHPVDVIDEICDSHGTDLEGYAYDLVDAQIKNDISKIKRTIRDAGRRNDAGTFDLPGYGHGTLPIAVPVTDQETGRVQIVTPKKAPLKDVTREVRIIHGQNKAALKVSTRQVETVDYLNSHGEESDTVETVIDNLRQLEGGPDA